MLIEQLTNAQYYRGINRRFDRRSLRLRQLGFKYTCTEYGAVFIRTRAWSSKKQCISSDRGHYLTGRKAMERTIEECRQALAEGFYYVNKHTGTFLGGEVGTRDEQKNVIRIADMIYSLRLRSQQA